jgi:hypothetical protein
MIKVGLRIGDAKDWGGGGGVCIGCHFDQKTHVNVVVAAP